MRRFSLVSALALVILVLGCGSHSPTAPPAASTVTAVTITGADTILTGLSTFYTVTAAFGDGTSQTVTPIWSSSNPKWPRSTSPAGWRVEPMGLQS